MAKYEVNFSCGHKETIQLFGKHTERDRKIEYFTNYGQCSECYKKAKKQEAIDYKTKKFENDNYEKVEVKYSDYKNIFYKLATVEDSYNPETKTIKVYKPIKENA